MQCRPFRSSSWAARGFAAVGLHEPIVICGWQPLRAASEILRFGMDENLYQELSLVLALNTYSRCVSDADGCAVYEHFNENGLDVPPDILARLGVMCPEAPDKRMCSPRHFFRNAWTPQKPLTLNRHEGEPSLFDLVVAVCLLVEWDGQQVRQGISARKVPPPSEFPELDLSDHGRFGSEPQLTFRDMSFWRAANRLHILGLGQWNENGRFELIRSLRGNRSPIDLAETYREARHITAERLGGSEKLFPAD